MREYPILFSDPMVKAILDGRKTQTRRVLKGNPENVRADLRNEIPGPYGSPGDRLWVREAAQLRACGTGPDGELEWFDLRYRADDTMSGSSVEIKRESCKPYRATRWTPSIHMPRWASRIILEVKDVRVERLRSITGEDAEAEGVESVTHLGPCKVMAWKDYGGNGSFLSPVESYRSLWDSLNKDRGYGWARNPWVWVVSFRRLKA